MEEGAYLNSLAPLAQKYKQVAVMVNSLGVVSSMGGMVGAYQEYSNLYPDASPYQRGYVFGEALCNSYNFVKSGRGIAGTVRALATEENKIYIVRDSNPVTQRLADVPGYRPKPVDVKGKTIQHDPSRPLSHQPDAGLASAKGLSAGEVRSLRARGYTIEGPNQIIQDANGNRFYSDVDLHGVYHADGRDAWSEGMEQSLNKRFGNRLFQHGPHDNWAARNNPGANAGPQPPVTAYNADGSVTHLKTVEAMKTYYRLNNMPWSKLYLISHPARRCCPQTWVRRKSKPEFYDYNYVTGIGDVKATQSPGQPTGEVRTLATTCAAKPAPASV